MDDEERGPRLSKRFSDKTADGEVDYKTKSGTAWSHSYLNQKPWHPLSYPNQRRKWIAEQTNAQQERRAEEVAREVILGQFTIYWSICSISPITHLSDCSRFIPNAHNLLFCNGFVTQYAQEQEFFRQAALVSKKEKEKVRFRICFPLFRIFVSLKFDRVLGLISC